MRTRRIRPHRITRHRILKNQGQERKRAGRKIAVAVGGAVLTAAVAAGAVYVGMGQKYKRVYFPNTTINGLDVSGLTPEETKTKITEGTSGYILTLQERGGADEVICGSEIGLHPEFDGTLEQIMAKTRVLLRGFHVGRYVDYTIDTMAAFDETKLSDAVSGLNCLKPEQAAAPEDAYISDYISGTDMRLCRRTRVRSRIRSFFLTRSKTQF